MMQALSHPSSLLLLLSSHSSLAVLMPSPQNGVQSSAEVDVPPVQSYPHSTLHDGEHPSPPTVFPSSQKMSISTSAPRVSPSPQISLPVSHKQADAPHSMGASH